MLDEGKLSGCSLRKSYPLNYIAKFSLPNPILKAENLRLRFGTRDEFEKGD
jgi:hypothetical protein